MVWILTNSILFTLNIVLLVTMDKFDLNLIIVNINKLKPCIFLDSNPKDQKLKYKGCKGEEMGYLELCMKEIITWHYRKILKTENMKLTIPQKPQHNSKKIPILQNQNMLSILQHQINLPIMQNYKKISILQNQNDRYQFHWVLDKIFPFKKIWCDFVDYQFFGQHAIQRIHGISSHWIIQCNSTSNVLFGLLVTGFGNWY